MFYVLTFLLMIQTGADSNRVKKNTAMTISQVLKAHSDEWMKIRGVVGTGESLRNGKPCIVVFIEKDSAAIRQRIPRSVNGYDVILEVTGIIKAQNSTR
jgi:hypothetical protein